MASITAGIADKSRLFPLILGPFKHADGLLAGEWGGIVPCNLIVVSGSISCQANTSVTGCLATVLKGHGTEAKAAIITAARTLFTPVDVDALAADTVTALTINTTHNRIASGTRLLVNTSADTTALAGLLISLLCRKV